MNRLIPPLTPAQRAAFIAHARSRLRTPFRHRGRSERGMDCLGLLVLSLLAAGAQPVDRKQYGRDPQQDGLREAAQAHFGPPVWRRGEPLDRLQPGDVVLMQWHLQPNHIAIVVEHPLGCLALVHALASAREVIEHRLAAPWPRRIVEGYRP